MGCTSFPAFNKTLPPFALKGSCDTNFRTETRSPHFLSVQTDSRLTVGCVPGHAVKHREVPRSTGPGVGHSDGQMVSQTYTTRQGIRDLPSKTLRGTIHHRGSGFVQGHPKTSYAAVSSQQPNFPQVPLPQKAELIALTWTLILEKGKNLNIYRDANMPFWCHTAMQQSGKEQLAKECAVIHKHSRKSCDSQKSPILPSSCCHYCKGSETCLKSLWEIKKLTSKKGRPPAPQDLSLIPSSQ